MDLTPLQLANLLEAYDNLAEKPVDAGGRRMR